MHNDFISIIEKYLHSTMEASNLVPLPIAIVDEELKQFWENCYMKGELPVFMQQGQYPRAAIRV